MYRFYFLTLRDDYYAEIANCAGILMPLSGWLMVSASPFGLPTFVFVDWIKWPHIPGVTRNKTVETLADSVHWITATGLVSLIIGHVSAVVWHKKKHDINFVSRMWWNKSEGSQK